MTVYGLNILGYTLGLVDGWWTTTIQDRTPATQLKSVCHKVSLLLVRVSQIFHRATAFFLKYVASLGKIETSPSTAEVVYIYPSQPGTLSSLYLSLFFLSVTIISHYEGSLDFCLITVSNKEPLKLPRKSPGIKRLGHYLTEMNSDVQQRQRGAEKTGIIFDNLSIIFAKLPRILWSIGKAMHSTWVTWRQHNAALDRCCPVRAY